MTAKAPATPAYMRHVQKWDPYWSSVLGAAGDRDKARSNVQLNPNKRIIQTYGSAPALYAPYTGDGIDAVTYAMMNQFLLIHLLFQLKLYRLILQ